MQYGFVFDSNKCAGCKTCQVACKELHNLEIDNIYRKVYNYGGGSWQQDEDGFWVPQDPFGYFVSIACNHCTNPACVENCPTGAMQKDPDTGIVWTDHEVCIGCKTCETACPYGAPTYSEANGYMLKCDMCRAEVSVGDEPVCVTACLGRALDFGDIEELRATYGDGDVEIEPLPANTTSPNLIIKPHPRAQKSGAGTGAVLNLEEEL